MLRGAMIRKDLSARIVPSIDGQALGARESGLCSTELIISADIAEEFDAD